ncbi:MAG: cation-translocating P-type ATPase, partial [Gammaproteobacteria bacterium]
LLLAVAAIISGLLGESADAAAIVLILVLNAAIGAIQEYRAQRAVAALRRMSTPEARVVRNGRPMRISSVDLVPGDLVEIQAGDIVPADLRVVSCHELSVDESALTGESLPVEKDGSVLDKHDLPVGDRRNMLFKSTAITKGHGHGIVVATGLGTEIGSIATLLSTGTDPRTPLQQRLARFGRWLALGVIGICALIFMMGILIGEPPVLMFLTAVSLAVAAVPEALPAVVTIALALGARNLSRRRSLVRNLPAVETLGSVTYICSDKTGTLTENRMRVTAIHAAAQDHADLDGFGDDLRTRLGEAMALCNEITAGGDADPTELALADAAARAGFEKSVVSRHLPVIQEFAFDSDRKMMSTIHQREDGAIVFVKGAPEALLNRCDTQLERSGQPRTLDKAAQSATADRFARDGYRVLAFAVRELPSAPAQMSVDEAESQLTLLGLVALEDPIRSEVPDAIADCRRAGITAVMITGDHPITAQRIAASLNLDDGQAIVTGPELVSLSDEALRERVRDVRVYARVDPAQKIRIVEALHANGEHVAMTGDGVNDAPALKQASIGVAMGQRGTDVAREAADMVLLDDNFATIVSAIREGRRVYDNIRKFIKYTMTSNTGEIWTLVLALLIGLPVPLLPIHILWINLVTDGLPGLAYSAEPAESDVMRRPPRTPTEGIFARGMWQHMLTIGLMIGALAIVTAVWADTSALRQWQTMVFTTLVIAQLSQALALRSESQTLASLGIFSNPYMIGTIAATLIVQLLVVYLPAFNRFLHTEPLPLADLALCLGLGLVVLPVIEIHKLIRRSRAPGATAVRDP